MIKFCSCFHCGATSQANPGVLDPVRLPNSSRMFGHPNCFNPPFPVRTPRPFKRLCWLTTILAFCIGIGIGVLIPLCLLPGRPELLRKNISRSNPFQESSPSAEALESHLRPTPTSLPNPIQSPESFSGRFPEFAQLQSLQQQIPEPMDKSPNPILRRPSPNVQFVATDSRILSLHPIQQELPKVRYNVSTESKVGGGSTTSKSESDPLDNSDLLDGIYWSSKVEELLPRGFTDTEANDWRRFVQGTAVLKVEEGCGRMQNRLLSLENGTQACCRYRQNSDQIQGEIFSYYLGGLLGLRNLAPSTLDMIQPLDRKWTGVRPQLNLAQWTEEKPVVLTRFIPNLSPAFIPAPFRDSRRSLHPVDILLSANSVESLDVKELAQWSDLVVFDYLTANLDRMVNNLYNLQWNPAMMDAPAHNLAKDVSSGLLVFLDNESGLLHGYRLLDKYEQYHRLMLDSLCVFRASTAAAVKRLARDKNVGSLLKDMFIKLEPTMVDFLPTIPDKSIKILNSRIQRVHERILKCESLYMS